MKQERNEESKVEMVLTAAFWSALAAIVIINLVLSGDNAIVIAFAARNLPRKYQSRAIVWGTVGAVVVRVSLTVAVVWLLMIPGLSFGGGVLLAWIAYQLLTDGDGGRAKEVAPASSFWGAMRTIVIADAAMGLDNVLVITHSVDQNLYLSSRNLPNVLVVEPRNADPVSLLKFEKTLLTRDAVTKLEEMLT